MAWQKDKKGHGLASKGIEKEDGFALPQVKLPPVLPKAQQTPLKIRADFATLLGKYEFNEALNIMWDKRLDLANENGVTVTEYEQQFRTLFPMFKPKDESFGTTTPRRKRVTTRRNTRRIYVAGVNRRVRRRRTRRKVIGPIRRHQRRVRRRQRVTGQKRRYRRRTVAKATTGVGV